MNAIGPDIPALPPGATVLLVDSPELQLTIPINAIPSIAVVAPVITLVRFLFVFMWPSFFIVLATSWEAALITSLMTWQKDLNGAVLWW
jgi:hypothetical protein